MLVLQSIGDDDDAVEASSAELTETQEGFQPVFFDPRPLRNLRLVDEVESLSPIMDFKVGPTLPVKLLPAVLLSAAALQPGTRISGIAAMPIESGHNRGWVNTFTLLQGSRCQSALSAGGQSAEGRDSAAVCHVRPWCTVHSARVAARLGGHGDCSVPPAREPHCCVDPEAQRQRPL